MFSTSIKNINGNGSFQVKRYWSKAATTVTFDATTNGGQMPSDWIAPIYYIGDPYGSLPIPTHPTLSFSGWYIGQDKIKDVSIVQSNNIVLVAQYGFYSIDLNSGAWQQSTSIQNPDSEHYDGVYESTNQGIDSSFNKMYIHTNGYADFTVLIRSYAELNYDYVVACVPDIDPNQIIAYNSSEAYASTYDHGNSTGTALSDYIEVVYHLDGGEHTICIMYRKDSSDNEGYDQGYVLIPKQQGEV